MRMVDAYRLARGNLKRTRLRTTLTIGGVVVSIASIVLLVSLGVGLQQLSVQQIASINALSRLTAMPEEGSKQKLDTETIGQIEKLPNVRFVSPEMHLPARVTFLETQGDVMAIGLNKEYLNFSDIRVTTGQAWKEEGSKEVLVSKAVLKLFGKDNDAEGVIGKDMSFQVMVPKQSGKEIGEINFMAKIVGTTEDETLASIYMPLGLLATPDLEEYSAVTIKVSDRGCIKDIKQKLEGMDLQTTAVSDLVDQIDQAFFYFQVILGVIGGIALFVAAIGIINTMTISLLERTHEIGIMKAVGALDRDIRRIFTYEAAIIGFLGGALGIGMGWLLGQMVNFGIDILLKANGQPEGMTLFIMPVRFALWVLGLSTLLSVLAGIYPARRAARLSPLQALRYQ